MCDQWRAWIREDVVNVLRLEVWLLTNTAHHRTRKADLHTEQLFTPGNSR